MFCSHLIPQIQQLNNTLVTQQAQYATYKHILSNPYKAKRNIQENNNI